jgi:hypothetical protein
MGGVALAGETSQRVIAPLQTPQSVGPSAATAPIALAVADQDDAVSWNTFPALLPRVWRIV